MPESDRPDNKTPQREVFWPTGQAGIDYANKIARMEKALKIISEFPYDDKEKEYPDEFGKTAYEYLSEADARDYLIRATDTAWRALNGQRFRGE